MAYEAEKALVRRCFDEVWSTGRLDVIDEICTEPLRVHAPGARDLEGRAAFKRYVRAYRDGFPDLRMTVTNAIAEGDRVVVEFDMRGRHGGKWFGVPRTGHAIDLSGCAFSRITDGRIAEQWYEWERRQLLEQLELLPKLAVGSEPE